jgi:ubiquinone/menaquinone biosynthesis C-methylase UbiE
MEDKSILFADLKGSTASKFSSISDILGEVKKLPAKAIDKNTWGDAYFAVFNSSEEAVRHALEVRDALRFHDWRAIGADSQPKLRIAIAMGPVSWKDDSIDNLRSKLTGLPFVDAARIEPVVTAGEVWVTSAVASNANKSHTPSFYFESLGDITLPKNFGTLPVFRAQWSKDSSWLKTGVRLPLEDDQYRGRATALRRFALMWLLLDQLPIGSWGRSTASWMNAVWQDIPSISGNRILEDEGGFETTILNLQLLFELLPDSFRFSKVCNAAYHYLEHRNTSQGFGTLGMERQGAEIEPRPRHTALAAWLFGCIAKNHSLKEAKASELFRLACLALFAGDPERTHAQFLGDRHPLLLYLAAGHVIRELNSSGWKGILSDDEMRRVTATWDRCEPELRLRACESNYPREAPGPPHLIELRGHPFPFPVPYGGFVRTETYSVLSASLLCDTDTAPQVMSMIAEAIAHIANEYLILFGSPEKRYSRDPLRPFLLDAEGYPQYRGIPPHLAGEASPDLGCTALLYRVLRNPNLRDAVQQNWHNRDVGIDQTRYFLEEDLIHAFDRYLVAPQLFSLSHAGMLAALLGGDHCSLVESASEGIIDYLNHPRTAVNLREDTLSTVLSEKSLLGSVEQLVCNDPRIDPPVLQISTNSLVRLLVDKVRPARYAVEENLTRSAIRNICQNTAGVYSDEAFLKKYEYTWGKAVDESILKPFLAMIQPNSRILDVGCGPGYYALEFQKAGHVVDLFDCSMPALNLATSRLSSFGPHRTFFGDITENSVRGLIPAGTQYDGIWCSGVIAHLPRAVWPEILEWFKSLQAPSGVLFVNVMVDNPCLFSRDGRYFTYLRSASEFEQALAKAGFEVSHSLRKKLIRNTYNEPLIQRSWANFYARPSRDSEPEFGPVAAAMTTFAYERAFKIFASCHPGGPERQKYIDDDLEVLSKYLGHPTGQSILDVGCGTGDVLRALANQGYTAVGVDISEHMIALAKLQIANVTRGSVSLELCDMCELPADWTDRFDAALCITALQHQSVIGGRFDKALSEFHRVLKPGGFMRIDSRIGLDSGFDPDLRYIQVFSDKSEVLKHIHQAGFEVMGEPVSWTVPPGRNSFRRDTAMTFLEFWLRKPTRD